MFSIRFVSVSTERFSDAEHFGENQKFKWKQQIQKNNQYGFEWPVTVITIHRIIFDLCQDVDMNNIQTEMTIECTHVEIWLPMARRSQMLQCRFYLYMWKHVSRCKWTNSRITLWIYYFICNLLRMVFNQTPFLVVVVVVVVVEWSHFIVLFERETKKEQSIKYRMFCISTPYF